jgi:hypothetical protein
MLHLYQQVKCIAALLAQRNLKILSKVDKNRDHKTKTVTIGTTAPSSTSRPALSAYVFLFHGLQGLVNRTPASVVENTEHLALASFEGAMMVGGKQAIL